MSYCTNQGHEDLGGNWDDLRRIPLTNNFHSRIHLSCFFFLFAVSPFPAFDLCLVTFPLFFCFLFTHSFFLFISSIFTPYLPVTPAWHLFPSQKISDTGRDHGRREIPTQFFFLALYQLSWEKRPYMRQIRTSHKHQLMDIVKIKVKVKNWPLQPSRSASPGNVYILFLVHTFLTTQKELVRVLQCLCIKDPI